MQTPIRLRADTHVHFHECFQESSFLNAAADSLCPAAEVEGQVQAVLCLTESFGASWFERLRKLADTPVSGIAHWKVLSTQEANSVIAVDEQGRRLAIIAGRQIVCEESLEVLALGMVDTPNDRTPIDEVLRNVARSGAVPVLPWGFGKWVGGRRRVIERLLADPPCDFVLGDNGGRLSTFAEPQFLAEFRQSGGAVLPGTDPFPFVWDSERVGSFGVEWKGSASIDRPFADFRRLARVTGKPFGALERLPSFFRNQIAIQLRRFTR